jgi:hypothetical protein
VTTPLAFYSFGPFKSSWLCLMNLFTIAPIPIWGPLSWLMPNKTPKHRTPIHQIWVSTNKIPWSSTLELERTHIQPRPMLSGLKPIIQHILPM